MEVVPDSQQACPITEGLLIMAKGTKGDVTKLLMLDTGVKLWPNVTARAIARKIGLSHSAVAYHFKDDLLNQVAAHAVDTGNSKVITQLIATNHKAVRKLSPSDRLKHLKVMA